MGDIGGLVHSLELANEELTVEVSRVDNYLVSKQIIYAVILYGLN